MAGKDVASTDYSRLDAGTLLPGCSLPIANSEGDDRPGVHAFRELKPLPIDGLSRSAVSQLTDSMVEVARSLRRLHQAGCTYGRITSTSFHNQGTSTAPKATLWIDPSLAEQTDVVHQGDAESMYWTPTRIQSGDPATAADDWYALGIVLSEVALSSTAVHKIWELSQTDGKFVPQLLKNLRRARVDRRLKSMASALIREGSSGEVSESTINRILKGQSATHKTALLTLLVLTPLVLGIAAVDLSRSSELVADKDEEIEALTARTSELEDQVRMLTAQAARPTVQPMVPAADPAPVVQDVRIRDQDRWSTEFKGGSLEDTIKASQSFEPAAWRARLVQLNSMTGQRQWRKQDATLRRLVQKTVDQPWDFESYEKAVERINACNEAYARWLAWARSSKTVEEVRTQHDLMPSGIAKGLLGSWLSEALEVQSFDVNARVVEVGEDNKFVSHLIEYETPSDSESISWTWDSTDGKDATINFAVENYRVGDPLTIRLDQDSSIPYWDSTVIEHQFNSPLLVWQMARGLRLADQESGYAISLSTNKRFGPPGKLDTVAAVSDAVFEREVIDPIKELPFDID